jgi:cytochrome c-type biogenesis protein CcmH/NrfG
VVVTASPDRRLVVVVVAAAVVVVLVVVLAVVVVRACPLLRLASQRRSQPAQAQSARLTLQARRSSSVASMRWMG